MKREELEALAIAEYNAAAGTVIEVNYLAGYDEHDNSVDLHFDPPIRVRVDPNQKPQNGILHWNCEYLDPYWDVTPVDPNDSRLAGTRSWWTDGPSHKLEKPS